MSGLEGGGVKMCAGVGVLVVWVASEIERAHEAGIPPSSCVALGC